MQDNPILPLGSRRELFIDDFMVESLSGGARRVLHRPRSREIVLTHDRPWEGNVCGYHTFFRDGRVVRAFYRGWQVNRRLMGHPGVPPVVCTAESDDGIRWRRPVVGLFEFQGSTVNNIVYTGRSSHNFAPFKDARPDVPPDQLYKALGRIPGPELMAYYSPDGLHWRPAADHGVITDGKFDSQNLAFWDTEMGCYRAYYRDFKEGIRDIKMATSDDFIHWSKGEWLEYPGAPVEDLYTNQISPYPRAPHLLVGFPTRYLPDRGQITEGVLMSSRDGRTFHRWTEALLPPGPNRERWGNRCNYTWHGLIETPSDEPGAPNEYSLYCTENYYEAHTSHVRRYSLRIDGFVSVNGPLAGGELITRPFTFEGTQLSLNVATSAAGTVKVELQTPEGRPLEGFEADNCEEIWGDDIDRTVVWKDAPDLGALAGRPVRMRVELHDADLYSFKFA